MQERLVVIGGVAAGMSAAAKAKREAPDMDVIVYEKSPFISYAACGIPYWLAGDIQDYASLLTRTPEQMAREGVQVYLRHLATEIHPEDHALTVRDLSDGHDLKVGYDRLVIATGARPAQLGLAGHETGRHQPLGGVLALRSLETGLAVQQFLQEARPERAVVIGGGYVAVEMAETFRRLGLQVTMLVRSGKLMRSRLDEDVGSLVAAELSRHGVDVMQGVPLAFEGNGRIRKVVTQDGCMPCDLALFGVGLRPNVEVAHEAGVALGTTGAIAVDSYQRTNLPDVYAAGDCAEALNLLTGEPDYIPLGTTANKQGRVAGTNAARGQATFGGVVGTMVVRVFDLAVGRSGLTSAQARAAGFEPQETMITAKDVAHYFPGAADMRVKLLADAPSGRLLGGQIVGRPEVAKRIDVLAVALHHRLTVAELQRLDLSYAPPFAPVWDPILVAANIAAR